MARELKPGIKIIGVLLLVGVALLAVKLFAPGLLDKIAPAKPVAESTVPLKADLPQGPAGGSELPPPAAAASVSASDFPRITEADLDSYAKCQSGTEARWLHWFWMTHSGVILANEGKEASADSAMCRHGMNLKLQRQDDVVKQGEGLIAFASALKAAADRGERNPNPSEGAHFVSLMGDGTAGILTEWNATLDKLGPGYRAKGFFSGGYSRGEDCLMAPPAWKENPQAARGGVCAAYLRDGDWNIGMKWLGDNGICNNPDETTYDPNCMNWVAATTYIDAANKYVAGYAEERPVVNKGKHTGEKRRIAVNCVATWTPGDNIVADQRGGLVKVASTKEYRFQMPMVVIGIDRWMTANQAVVEGFIEASLEGNQRIASDDREFRRAAALSAVVYNEPDTDAAYVYRYFKGATERDKTGLFVERGGSSVNNLGDNCQLFGLQSCAPGSTSIYKATYETFGRIVVQQYPKLVPRFMQYEEVVDTRYLEAVAARQGTVVRADMPTFTAEPIRQVLSRRSWNINFATGQAAFSNGARAQLDELFKDLVIAGETKIVLHGHTDSVGNPDANMTLSEARAFAVKRWLMAASPVHFPDRRVDVVAHGQTQPVEPNTTEAGRSKNRRVEVVLGTLN